LEQHEWLLIHHPAKSKAPATPAHKTESKAEPKASKTESKPSDFLVSSKHLCLASPRFRKIECEDVIKKYHGMAIGDDAMCMQIRYADTPAQREVKRVTAVPPVNKMVAVACGSMLDYDTPDGSRSVIQHAAMLTLRDHLTARQGVPAAPSLVWPTLVVEPGLCLGPTHRLLECALATSPTEHGQDLVTPASSSQPRIYAYWVSRIP
jgi:hypothetical protein